MDAVLDAVGVWEDRVGLVVQVLVSDVDGEADAVGVHVRERLCEGVADTERVRLMQHVPLGDVVRECEREGVWEMVCERVERVGVRDGLELRVPPDREGLEADGVHVLVADEGVRPVGDSDGVAVALGD